MSIKQKLLSLLIFPLVVSVSNESSANVDTTVRTEVSGSNASVWTQIINKVNEVTTEITSTQPGEIKVSVKNGKVETKISTPSATPFPKEEVKRETQRLQEQIRDFFNNFLSRILRLFKLGA